MLTATAPAFAQGIIRGAVVSSATGAPVGYSIVSLGSAFSRFTDDSGAFTISDLPPGRYHVMVRQLGYFPLDTVVAVAAEIVSLRLALHPLAIELPAVTVMGETTCLAPGRPEPASDPRLAQLFDQLHQNAERYRLLADSYPYRYWIARTFSDALRDGRVVDRTVDTLERSSAVRWPYAPGKLVRQLGSRRDLIFPELPDLADSVFHRTHCFWFGGQTALGGGQRARLEFRAYARLTTPDVDGTAYLDPETYQLRELTLTLTRPDRAVAGVRRVHVEIAFGEVVPSIVVPALVSAITTWKRPEGQVAGRGERQELLRVEFQRQIPIH